MFTASLATFALASPFVTFAPLAEIAATTTAAPAPAIAPAASGTAASASDIAPPRGQHPPDPLAAEYTPIPPRGEAAAPGQLHFLALAGMGYYRDIHLAGQGTFELVALPHVGVRGSLGGSVPLGLTDAQLFSARVGPSLHLLPYRLVDLGLYVEVGAATVDIFRARRTGMFTFVPGATFDLALGTSFIAHLDAQVQMGILDRDGNADLVVVPLLLFGLGPVL